MSLARCQRGTIKSFRRAPVPRGSSRRVRVPAAGRIGSAAARPGSVGGPPANAPIEHKDSRAVVSFRAAGPGSAGVSPAIALADCNVSRRTLGNSTSRAFTLVELLTSMAVLAILATITIGAVRGVKERASIAQARADLAALSTALEEFKRHFGDYPQLGEFGQAPATPTGVSATMPNGSGPGINTVPAKLFNCLTGVFGARAFGNADRVNGPNFLPPQLAARNRINGNLTTSYLVPVSNVPNPPSKTEQNVSLLDPWGRRYLYYYKNARNPNNWQATGYVLFSAGSRVAANGTQTPPINVQTGIFLPTQTPEMVDNIYSH